MGDLFPCGSGIDVLVPTLKVPITRRRAGVAAISAGSTRMLGAHGNASTSSMTDNNQSRDEGCPGMRRLEAVFARLCTFGGKRRVSESSGLYPDIHAPPSPRPDTTR